MGGWVVSVRIFNFERVLKNQILPMTFSYKWTTSYPFLPRIPAPRTLEWPGPSLILRDNSWGQS